MNAAAKEFDNRGASLGMTVDHRGPALFRSLDEAHRWCAQQHAALARAPVPLDDARALAIWRDLSTANAMLARRCAIERAVLEFRNFSSQFEFATGDVYLAQLRERWWSLQESVCGNYDRPVDESLCDDTCLRNNCLLTLCAELALHGCTEHGTLHLCRNRVRRCPAQCNTSHATVVCLFSGEEVDRITSSLSGASGGHEYREGAPNANINYRESMLEHSKMPTFTYIGKRVVTDGGGPAASGPMPSARVLALRQLFEGGGGGGGGGGGAAAAAAAGRQLQRSFRFGRKVTELQRAAEHRLRCIARKVIDDVLFDKEKRMLFNRVARQEAERTAVADVNAYYSQCRAGIDGEQVLPRRLEAAIIYATPFRRITLLPLVAEDRLMVARFETLCSRLWALCHRTRFARTVADGTSATKQSRHAVRQTTCTYEQFCLGVLYAMRAGVTLRRGGGVLCVERAYQFVPGEWRLHLQLPPLDSVDAFSDQSAREMARNTELLATTVAFGDTDRQRTAVPSSLFKADGTLKLRKKRQARRITTTGSGARRVAFGRNLSVAEREILPPHLHSSLLNDTGAYEKSGVARGLNFLDRCLHSIPDNDIEVESRALWF